MGTKLEESRAFQDSESDSEAEETLSLSDLPIYSTSIDTHAAAKHHHRHRHRRHEEDFEFFSEDFTASTRRRPPDSIVFCGKIIYPFQEVVLKQKQEEITDHRKNSRSWIFRWKWNTSFAKSKSTGTDRPGLSVQKVSVRSKSNWWHLFGLGNFMHLPAPEMELRDIKMRQRRRRHQVVVAADVMGRRDGKGFWGLYW